MSLSSSIADAEGVNGSPLDQPKNVGETRDGEKDKTVAREREIKEHIFCFCRVSQHFFDPLLGRNCNDVCVLEGGKEGAERTESGTCLLSYVI